MKIMIRIILIALFPLFVFGQKPGELTVSGTAKKLVNADEMIISTGISRESDDASELQKQVQQKMANALKYLEGRKGVKRVETDFIRIYNRGPIQKRGTQKQFSASQSITIVLTDFDLYDQLMLDLFDLGFNNIGSATFNVSNRAEIKRQVQLEAIKVAKEKARDFAKELGVLVGDVMSFREHNFYMQPNYTANKMTYDSNAGGGSASSSIAPAQVVIEMTVVVSFTIDNAQIRTHE